MCVLYMIVVVYIDMSKSMSDFGVSFALFGQCEGGDVGQALDLLSKTVDYIATLTSHNVNTVYIYAVVHECLSILIFI